MKREELKKYLELAKIDPSEQTAFTDGSFVWFGPPILDYLDGDPDWARLLTEHERAKEIWRANKRASVKNKVVYSRKARLEYVLYREGVKFPASFNCGTLSVSEYGYVEVDEGIHDILIIPVEGIRYEFTTKDGAVYVWGDNVYRGKKINELNEDELDEFIFVLETILAEVDTW